MAARFFIEGTHTASERVAFDDADAHKILHVLRLRDGDPVEVFDSGSRAFVARLAVDGSQVVAELGEPVDAPESGGPAITVAQGIPKGSKMDFIVEKLSELGAFELLPLASARAIAEAGEVKRTRWSRLAKTAAQQCGRRSVMRIGEPVTIEVLAERCAGFDAVLVPWESAAPKPLRETLPALIAGARNIAIVVGPEGGFAHAEVERLQAAGAHPISLGPRILRTETAAMALVAALNYLTDG